MKWFQSVTEIVRSVNSVGKPNHALAALLILVLAPVLISGMALAIRMLMHP
jgi:hypothetical protein